MIPKRSKGASQMRLNFYLFWNDIHVHWRKHSLCIRCTSWYHHFMSIDNFRYVMLASFSFSTNFLSCSLMCRNENSQHAGIHMTTLLVSTVIEPQSDQYFVSDWHMVKVQHCRVSARWHIVPPTHCVRILTAPLNMKFISR